MTQQEAPNPLFAGFNPQPIGGEQAQEPTPVKPAKKPRKPRKPKPAKEPAATKPKKPRAAKPKPTALKPVEPAVQNLQAVFAAVKELEDADYPLFEKLLAASPASRKRVFVAIAKIFP